MYYTKIILKKLTVKTNFMRKKKKLISNLKGGPCQFMKIRVDHVMPLIKNKVFHSGSRPCVWLKMIGPVHP